MSRSLCIHGHFYQPSRENPWTGTVELTDAAAPFHDWNARVAAECYARNAAARIQDDAGHITRIVNNYARISHNVGPTLLRWLQTHARATYDLILDADRQSRRRQYGHGNALAQVYNHVIMPLATSRDRTTQVRWGIRDFERRFRRRPEGLWLSETAVDLETLEILVAHGIAFTILAPHQAKRIRRADGTWADVTAETLDVTVPYRCRLPSGRTIAVFFYHGPTSHAVSFEGLLHDGAAFAARLAATVPADQQARLLVVASDGETYGHHHQFGEMALAYALQRLARAEEVQITNCAAFLAAHPPAAEVEIAERTSWSCAHGIERWRSDCGCNTGQGWHQRWRAPLRDAVSWLVGQLATIYETHGREVFKDPWAARDEAVDIIDPPPGGVDAFLRRHARAAEEPERRRRALRLLEIQRQAMLMQSSDGWFFDDVSGAETVQILSHAARAIELARGYGGDLEDGLMAFLRNAPGNLERYPTGAAVYETLVRPRIVGAREAAAHWAMTAFVGTRSVTAGGEISVTELDRLHVASGNHTLRAGRLRLRWEQTDDEVTCAYALAHFGAHEVHCAVASGWDDDHYAAVRATLAERFGRHGVSEIVRAIDAAFGPHYFTLRDLPLEDRRTVLGSLMEPMLQELEQDYRRLYQDNRQLMEYLRDSNAAVPPPLITAAVVALTHELEQTLAADASEGLRPRAREALAELHSWGREIHADRFEPVLRRRLEQILAAATGDAGWAERARDVLAFAESAGVTINLWEAQNAFYRLRKSFPGLDARELGERLHFAVDKIE